MKSHRPKLLPLRFLRALILSLAAFILISCSEKEQHNPQVNDTTGPIAPYTEEEWYW